MPHVMTPNGLRSRSIPDAFSGACPTHLVGYLRVCLDRLDNQAGVDSVREQEKPEASLSRIIFAGSGSCCGWLFCSTPNLCIVETWHRLFREYFEHQLNQLLYQRYDIALAHDYATAQTQACLSL